MPRFYTVEEANSLIPELTRLLRGMQAEERQLAMLRERTSSVAEKTRGNGHHNPDEDVALSQAVKNVEEALRLAVSKLAEWEIEVKDLQRGLVDFPARREGRTVLLCWQLGEPEVAFWHETTTGFAGREPIDDRFD